MELSEKDLFIFVDESGNFDFSPSGTSHFVFAAVATNNPAYSSSRMNSVKYQLLSDGIDVSDFHATEDKQVVRDSVFPVIDKMETISAYVIYGEKRFLAPSLQNPEGIYSLFGKATIKFFMRNLDFTNIWSITVVFDQTLTKKERSAFEGVIKPELKKLGIRFNIYFHSMKTDSNGQIADYIAWAKYVSLERSENRPWSALSQNLKPSDFNIFSSSN